MKIQVPGLRAVTTIKYEPRRENPLGVSELMNMLHPALLSSLRPYLIHNEIVPFA